MTKITNKYYDLEERTLEFAKSIIRLYKKSQNNTVNIVLIKQLIRSGTSVGANYREANESLSKKDFIHKIRITRKEAKETTYWLELLHETNTFLKDNIDKLSIESKELRNIFTSIISKSK